MYKIFNALSLKSLTVLVCYWFLYNSFQDKTACIGKHGFDNALSFWLLFAGAVCCCGSSYAIDKFCVLPYLSDLEFELQTWDIALCLFCFFFFQNNKPLYSFEDNSDYVYDVMWSPTHPALFACVDGMGRLDLWNLNNDTEVRQSS